jgi:hypothetical protein
MMPIVLTARAETLYLITFSISGMLMDVMMISEPGGYSMDYT